AFYGVFQMIAEHWPFLADLSGPDSFISFGTGFKIPLLGTIRGINILPILMGIVFFIQQKYMTPPTTANMTPEQIQQQKIMKWMMVILFPVMMYNTPSGLTLYILTSTTVGILESRYIRRHIDQMDVSPQAKAEKAAKPKGSLGRAWAKRLEAIREKQRMAKQEQRSFKKRK
ncbi:MAG TPA: YidC/Oxa1 family membrane protein insertase, partial [Phycisphaerales bacterium]|nr:YidC/Oxa1 family membrane protein insertase [Phycisphaerales bacterium]